MNMNTQRTLSMMVPFLLLALTGLASVGASDEGVSRSKDDGVDGGVGVDDVLLVDVVVVVCGVVVGASCRTDCNLSAMPNESMDSTFLYLSSPSPLLGSWNRINSWTVDLHFKGHHVHHMGQHRRYDA